MLINLNWESEEKRLPQLPTVKTKKVSSLTQPHMFHFCWKYTNQMTALRLNKSSAPGVIPTNLIRHQKVPSNLTYHLRLVCTQTNKNPISVPMVDGELNFYCRSPGTVAEFLLPSVIYSGRYIVQRCTSDSAICQRPEGQIYHSACVPCSQK